MCVCMLICVCCIATLHFWYHTFTIVELDHPNGKRVFDRQASRVARVARGSGTSIREVEELIKQYGKFAELVKKMGGMNECQSSTDGQTQPANGKDDRPKGTSTNGYVPQLVEFFDCLFTIFGTFVQVEWVLYKI